MFNLFEYLFLIAVFLGSVLGGFVTILWDWNNQDILSSPVTYYQESEIK